MFCSQGFGVFYYLLYLCRNLIGGIMEYKYDEESVNAIMDWARNVQFPEQVLLSEAECIVDVKRYVQANLNDIAAHYPDEFYNPAISRLYFLKEKLEEE